MFFLILCKILARFTGALLLEDMKEYLFLPMENLPLPSGVDHLIRAVERLDLDVFKDYLTQAVSDIDALGRDGRTAYGCVLEALDACCLDHDSSSRLDTLLSMARELKACGAHDFRPILEATASGDLDEVKCLIDSGLPASFSSVSSGSALDIARSREHGVLADYLSSINAEAFHLKPNERDELIELMLVMAEVDGSVTHGILNSVVTTERAMEWPSRHLIFVCTECQEILIEHGYFDFASEIPQFSGKPVSKWEKQLIEIAAPVFLDLRKWLVCGVSSHALNRRLENEWAQPLPLRAMSVEVDGNQMLFEVHLTTAALEAAVARDFPLFSTRGTKLRKRRGLAGLFDRVVGRISAWVKNPFTWNSLADEFQWIASCRSARFRWDIPTSATQLAGDLVRLEKAWDRLSENAKTHWSPGPVGGLQAGIPNEAIRKILALAESNPSALVRALRGSVWEEGDSVLELLKRQSFSRHLLVLMEEGSLFRIERMLDALGDDLYEMANHLESLANTQVWSPAKIERTELRIAEITVAIGELCANIGSIAAGAEDILRKNNVDQSESMDAWEEGMLYVRGLTTSSRPSLTPGGTAPESCPDGIRTFLASSSAPWIAEIRLLATACKIAGI